MLALNVSKDPHTIWTKKYWSAETSLEAVRYRSMKARLEARYSGWALIVT